MSVKHMEILGSGADVIALTKKYNTLGHTLPIEFMLILCIHPRSPQTDPLKNIQYSYQCRNFPTAQISGCPKKNDENGVQHFAFFIFFYFCIFFWLYMCANLRFLEGAGIRMLATIPSEINFNVSWHNGSPSEFCLKKKKECIKNALKIDCILKCIKIY